MPRDQANVWHCSLCLFDVCPRCQPDLLQTQNSEFIVGDVVRLVPPAIADYRLFSDASSGPMILGVDYPIRDVRPPHANVEGLLSFVFASVVYCIKLDSSILFCFYGLTLPQVGGMNLLQFESQFPK